MINCPYCNKQLAKKSLNRHLSTYHLDEYNKQVQLIKALFYDNNFGKATLDQYTNVILSIGTIYNIWKNTYNDSERKYRKQKYHIHKIGQNIINTICPICGNIKEKQLTAHIKVYHPHEYDKLIIKIRDLFYDEAFVRQNYDKYKDKLYGISYSTVYNLWLNQFGKTLVSHRKRINNFIQCLESKKKKK